jgi:hypothetical protein
MAIPTNTAPAATGIDRDGAAGSHATGQTARSWAGLVIDMATVVYGLISFRWARRQPRAIPVIHENVTLTPEGAEIWNQVVEDRDSPIGNPIHHRRRRLPEGDAGR